MRCVARHQVRHERLLNLVGRPAPASAASASTSDRDGDGAHTSDAHLLLLVPADLGRDDRWRLARSREQRHLPLVALQLVGTDYVDAVLDDRARRL